MSTPLYLRPTAIAAVAIGGLIGAPARYALGLSVNYQHWPVITFVINVVGAFLLGMLLEALTRLGPDSGWRQRLRLTLGTGVLGSFTTYSALAVDTDLLLRANRLWAATTYAIGTVAAGVLATAVGIAVGARLTARNGARAA
ncbi:fluoride efflux transporter FluC [Nocardia camponoti]|uniref:Fluoride-specific ion channel FluC n=1 Tax=Nocardia camponoti TaxID=1616106 RepID=A0A917QTT6_9NOCA|nr:CrcB family protein [Nocardia camponoti]GGK66987.1 putative fluoride ion transporter CrcB [Nocardia camponoti]